MAVMTDPAARKARTEQKRRLILRFLRSEIWSTPDVLSELIQTTDPRTINRTLASMELEGLVAREVVQDERREWRFVGITQAGQIAAWRPESEPLAERVFERGRVGLSLVNHTLDLQKLRIKVARAGWTGWSNTDRLPPEQRANLEIKSKSYKRPDALATHPQRGLLAIECERNIKSGKRYQAIVESHLNSMRQNKFAVVVWACPTPELARGLGAILGRIRTARLGGVETKIDDELRKRLIVTDYNSITSI